MEDEPKPADGTLPNFVSRTRGYVQERTKDEIDRDLQIRVNKTKLHKPSKTIPSDELFSRSEFARGRSSGQFDGPVVGQNCAIALPLSANGQMT